MMQNLLDNYFLQNPLRITERTRLITSLATALWNAQNDEPLNQDTLHLFLCDETRGDLTEEQKCFVRKCRAEVDLMYLRMLCKQEQERVAMCRPALPAKSRCVRFFRQGKVCTPLLVVRPLWTALGGFRGTKGQAG
ncbi:MAG: hypothetical protein IJ955_05630 [Oscillospiraceae bacterium]|nr:hypothetical protein [Oscillospiraceae bacterium]